MKESKKQHGKNVYFREVTLSTVHRREEYERIRSKTANQSIGEEPK